MGCIVGEKSVYKLVVCQAKKDSSTMKQDLEKHIKDIFDSLGIDSPFEVYCKLPQKQNGLKVEIINFKL